MENIYTHWYHWVFQKKMGPIQLQIYILYLQLQQDGVCARHLCVCFFCVCVYWSLKVTQFPVVGFAGKMIYL